MELLIKSVYPKYEKSTNKLMGYSLTFVNASGSYSNTELYSSEDMKTIFGCVSEKDCLDLKGKTVLESKNYTLKDRK